MTKRIQDELAYPPRAMRADRAAAYLDMSQTSDANEAISTTAASAGGRVDRCVELVGVDRLTPYTANARTHSREQIRKIAESIQAFGFNSPILVDEKGEVLAGHGRLEAAKFLGLKQVPTLRISHLSAPEKRAYLLADNRTAELAEWDLDILATELGDLLELDFEVELTGFDLDEIQEILDIPDEDAPEKDGVEADGAENDVLEPDSHVPVSRAGDEWLLGEHRLVCGNASDDRAYVPVDGIVRYWQILAESSATLAGTAKTFAEIEEERNGRSDAGSDQSVPAKREAA
jgi:ParB-like chromosome segregation protein Spo0J